MPPNVFIRSGRKAMSRFQLASVPALTISEGSPPHRSMIKRVAISIPVSKNAGSTPRSNRKRASEITCSLRPVVAVRIGSK